MPQPDKEEKREFVEAALEPYTEAKFEDNLTPESVALTVNTPNRGLESLLRASHRGGRLLTAKEIGEQKNRDVVALSEETLSPLATGEIIDLQLVGKNIEKPQAILLTLADCLLRKSSLTPASGKSTLLSNMMIQDLDQGNGFACFDPHGDLIDAVLERIPKHRLKDVILFDPADEDYPIGFNILSAHSELEKTLLASDLVSIFRRFSTSWGDVMNSILANSVVAFLESERGGNLLDLKRFLIDKNFREDFLSTVKDDEIRYYWQTEFPQMKGKPFAPLLTRLDTFLRSKLIRHIVSA